MRSLKQVQQELDEVLGEYGKAVDDGDESAASELSDRINELETEREWIML